MLSFRRMEEFTMWQRLLIFSLLVVTSGAAQQPTGNYYCAGNQNEVFFNTCSGPNGCSDVYPITLASGDRGTLYQERAYNCCGLEGTYLAAYSSCGGFAETKNPAIRQGLIQLAKEVDLLLPDCNGVYMPAKIALDESPSRQEQW